MEEVLANALKIIYRAEFNAQQLIPGIMINEWKLNGEMVEVRFSDLYSGTTYTRRKSIKRLDDSALSDWGWC